MLVNKTNSKYVAVSKVNGETIDFNKPFAMFIKATNMSLACYKNNENLQLFVDQLEHHEAFVNHEYSPYLNFVFPMIFIDGKLQFNCSEEEKAKYISNEATTDFFGKSEIEILELLQKIIQGQLNGKLTFSGNNVIELNFMSQETFTKLLNEKSAVYKRWSDGIMVNNFSQFYNLTLLKNASTIYEATEKSLKFHLDDIEDESKKRDISKYVASIKSTSNSHNYYKCYQHDIIYQINEELENVFMMHHENNTKFTKNEFLEVLKNETIAVIEKAAINKSWEHLLYVPFFESNRTPFGSDMLEFHTAVNRKNLMKSIYGELKTNDKNFEYCVTMKKNGGNDYSKFSPEFYQKFVLGV